MSSQTLSDRQRHRHANRQGQMDGQSEESDRQSRLVMQETPFPLDLCFADICWLSLAYTQIRGLEFKCFTFQVAASLLCLIKELFLIYHQTGYSNESCYLMTTETALQLFLL